MAAPLCLLVTRRLHDKPGWLAGGFVLQLALGLALALSNYQHWDGYREFARSMQQELSERRVWVNAEWGLRYYSESLGGVPLEEGHPVQAGEAVLTSELSFPVEFTTGGGIRSEIGSAEIRPTIPLQLIGLQARSAYSTVTKGYRPFDVTFEPIDRVRAEVVVERKPALSMLPMNAPEAESQIVSGIYKLEENAWRWMAGRGVLLLKPLPEAATLEIALYIPDASPARQVTVRADGRLVAEARFDGPGSHTIVSGQPVATSGDTVTIEILADRSFLPQGDQRELGFILSSVGLRKD
jgi:hypothetical protein